jgi:hypothetical protein
MAKTSETALARLVVELANVTGDQREECIETLVAFSRFAKDCGLSPAWKRLHELAHRLDDLKHGRVDPLLKPEKKGRGNVRDSSETWYERNKVLVCLEGLCRGGMNEQEAARHIAKKFPKVKSLVTRGGDIPKTILRWKRDLHEEPHLRRFGDDLFNDLYPLLDQAPLTKEEWRKRADLMLAKILA